MKLIRYAYVVLLCLVLAVLIGAGFFSREWMMWVFIVAGIVIGFAIENFLKKKFPTTFPPSPREKEVEQLLKELEQADEGKENDRVKLPRTFFGTVCEIVTVGLVGYALYRAWTLDIDTWAVISLAGVTLLAVISSYYPNIKKEDCEPSDLNGVIGKGNSLHARAVFVALLTLSITYFYGPDTYFRWRPIYLLFSVYYVAWVFIRHLLTVRSAAMMAKINNYNPANISVARTLEGTAFEIVTVLLLIGAWCVAALNHQLAGKGLLAIPVADLIMCSVFAIGLLILAYFPQWMDEANSFKNNRHVLASIRRYRIIAVIFALLALIIPLNPDLTEKELGYLYIAVLAINILISRYNRGKHLEETASTDNDQ